MRLTFALAVIIAVGTSGEATALSPCPKVTQLDTDVGTVFVDEGGMTLYTFRLDERYRPHCLGSCVKEWPPFDATGLVTCDEPNHNWSIIRRSDGRSQWALDGRPMYRSAKDVAPGEITFGLPDWMPAKVPCPAAKSRFGVLGEEEAFTVIGGAIAKGMEPLGELRRWCGIDLYDLAARADISASSIIAHESGRRSLSREARIAVGHALGVPIYLLLEE